MCIYECNYVGFLHVYLILASMECFLTADAIFRYRKIISFVLFLFYLHFLPLCSLTLTLSVPCMLQNIGGALSRTLQSCTLAPAVIIDWALQVRGKRQGAKNMQEMAQTRARKKRIHVIPKEMLGERSLTYSPSVSWKSGCTGHELSPQRRACSCHP